MDNSVLLNETEVNPFQKSTIKEKDSKILQSQSVKKSRPCKILALGKCIFNSDGKGSCPRILIQNYLRCLH